MTAGYETVCVQTIPVRFYFWIISKKLTNLLLYINKCMASVQEHIWASLTETSKPNSYRCSDMHDPVNSVIKFTPHPRTTTSGTNGLRYRMPPHFQTRPPECESRRPRLIYTLTRGWRSDATARVPIVQGARTTVINVRLSSVDHLRRQGRTRNYLRKTERGIRHAYMHRGCRWLNGIYLYIRWFFMSG